MCWHQLQHYLAQHAFSANTYCLRCSAAITDPGKQHHLKLQQFRENGGWGVLLGTYTFIVVLTSYHKFNIFRSCSQSITRSRRRISTIGIGFLEQVALIVIYSSGWGIIIALGLANKMFKGCKDGLLYFHYHNKGLITIMPVLVV